MTSVLLEQKRDAAAGPDSSIPLAVDLDGTLVKTDLLVESLLILLKEHPQFLFVLPFWLLKGTAAFKQEVARRIPFEAALLPYRFEVVEYLKTQKAHGCSIVLATASDQRLAEQVAYHLNIFDKVLASDGTTNLSGEFKRARLVSQFGEKGFDYIANGDRDMAVWRSARKVIVINRDQQFVKAVARVTQIQHIFAAHREGFVEYWKALRPQH